MGCNEIICIPVFLHIWKKLISIVYDDKLVLLENLSKENIVIVVKNIRIG